MSSASLKTWLRTTSFRLAAYYAALFALSAGLLLALVWLYGIGTAEREIERVVDSRLEALLAVHEREGLAGLRWAIARESLRPASPFLYALVDEDGRLLAGNLPRSHPLREGWEEFELEDDEDELAPGEPRLHLPVRGRGVRLDDDLLLWVGHDVETLHELRERLGAAVALGLLLTVAAALGGGLLMARQVSRHVEAMERAAAAIMEGDLARRLPERGTGDEFDRLARRLNAMLDRIQRLMESLRQVSSDVAHDLRTPLTRLRQRLEHARLRARSADDWAAAVEGAIADADELLATFDALLRIAEVESGRRRAAFAPVDLSALAAELAETYQPVAEDAGHPFEADIEPGVEVRGDRALLAQLMANLIENALRHTPPGTPVRLGLRRADGAAELEVADAGPGIPPAEREKVLQRFYRLDRSRGTPGSGLGLALADAVARLHGSRLELADNRPGLRAMVRLPVMTRHDKDRTCQVSA